MKRILFLLTIICFSNYFCFSQKIDPAKDKFLIIVDIQEYYTCNSLLENSAQNLIDSVNCVINHTNRNHVIYIKSIHQLLNLSLTLPFAYVTFDTSAMRLDKRMNVVSKHIFTKIESNAFTVKPLNDFLTQNHAKDIVVIGLMAEECVYESLIGGKNLGYNMYMIPEAIVGKSQKSKDEAIKKLIGKGIKVLHINTLEDEEIKYRHY